MRRRYLIPLIVAAAAAFSLVPSAVSQTEGTTITVTDVPFRCQAPIATYATDGLPLIIEHTTDNVASRGWNVNGAVRLDDGCVGDGTPAIDLIVHINGNGADVGPAGDALVLAGGTDIQIGEGSYAECGAGGAQGGHEDAFRANRGHRITMFGLTTGDWDTLTPTCHGAGGNLYFDNVNGSAAGSTDIVCVECKVVASAGAPSQQFGVGAGFGWSTDSGAVRGCFAAVRPTWHYRIGGNPIAVRAVDVDNFTIEFAQGTNTPLPGQPPASDCPLLDDEPPPTTTEEPPTTTEPPPTTTVEDPPPYDPECAPLCDERIDELQEALLLALADLEAAEQATKDCRRKLSAVNKRFHAGRGVYSVHRPIHWLFGCTGFRR